MKKRPQKMTVIRAVKLDPQMAAAMRRIRDEEGISESFQIRKGLTMWLESRGVRLKEK